MAQFIKLTKARQTIQAGKPSYEADFVVFVNADHIISFFRAQHDGKDVGSYVVANEDATHVLETVQEIMDRIDPPKVPPTVPTHC